VLFQSAGSVLAHSALAPPDVPADRLKALEEAFAKTVADSEYLADAAKQKLPITFTSKAKVVESVEQILSTPAALIETMKKVTG
jgi:tripartite-type tricarboxylate transporter receptor subunit TctC